MIDPKYADLPGIAYDQPDIYETEEVSHCEPFQDYQGLQDDNNSVERIYLDASDSFSKFKDKKIMAQDVDFSDTITTKTKLGYKVRTGEWKLSYRSEDETPIEKYQRIKIEIQELLEQINKIKGNFREIEKEEPKSLADIMHQIEITGKELDTLDIEKILSSDSIVSMSEYQEIRFKELQNQIEMFKQKKFVPAKNADRADQEGARSSMLKYQMTYFPDKVKVQEVARISHLEKRLGHLENLIGTSTDNTSKCFQLLKSQGITKSIEKLMANACLLNSSQLDILENKVSTLLHKMDSVTQKKAQACLDSRHEKTISELYELLKQTENVSQVLPQTIDRLLALRSLHEKAADFITRLKELEDSQHSIAEFLGNNKSLLEAMQKSFGSNLDVIIKDISTLSERVKKLKK